MLYVLGLANSKALNIKDQNSGGDRLLITFSSSLLIEMQLHKSVPGGL